MAIDRRWVRRVGLAVTSVYAGIVAFSGSVLASHGNGVTTEPGLFFATSEIAQVMLSIAAVSFVVLAARAYGGEIGKALYVAGGGVIIFASWQLLHGASQLLALQRPPANIGSAINLLVTVLLLAGFYMLYETISGHPTA